jgi:hypothetical protein
MGEGLSGGYFIQFKRALEGAKPLQEHKDDNGFQVNDLL